jgi:dTDP-4-amino-4,6-dideoxygalactose transaminase
MPAKTAEIVEIANRYEIPIVEDAAEALGSRFNNISCGTFGLIGILSFNGNKIITTSGGGALISNKVEYIEKAKFLATQARDKAPHYQHSVVGYNYRMSNIVAGIGRGQLEVLESRIAARRNNNQLYRKLLADYSFISFQNEPPGHFSNYWLTTIVVGQNKNGITSEKIRLIMDSENIETRPFWKPMHMQPVFAGYPAYLSGVSESLFNYGLCLPSGSNLSNEEKERIGNCLKSILQ